MSDRTAGNGRDPRQPGRADDWMEHSGSSVFGPRPGQAPPPPPPPDPDPWHTAPWTPPDRSPYRDPPPPEPRRPTRPEPGYRDDPWPESTRAYPAQPSAPGDTRPGDRRGDPSRGDGRGDRPGGGRRRGRGSGPGPDAGSGSGLRSPVGLGALLGVAGLAAFLAALLVLDGVGHEVPPPSTWDVVVPALLRHTAPPPAA